MEQNQQLTTHEIRETINTLSFFNKLHQSEIVKEKAKVASLDLNDSYCPITGEKLYKVLESGYYGYLKPHGKCKDCNKYYAYSELDMSDGVSQPRWPMRFIGVTCKVCKSEQNLD